MPSILTPGLGGPAPFSEQETRALADWMLKTRPVLTVNYHSAGGFILAGRDGLLGDISEAYANASGYARPQPGAGAAPSADLARAIRGGGTRIAGRLPAPASGPR